jgi:4-hydroxy-3-polyprenylbenzoate decarboxylase
MGRTERPRLIVGVSGASGAAYGVRTLAACRDLGVESHLVMSRASVQTLAQETGLTAAALQARADVATGSATWGRPSPPAPSPPWG